MPDNGPTHADVYSHLLEKLREIGAAELADEIERTIARGVVVPEQETAYYQKKSTVLRPMTDAEQLAIGLEFLVTASEIPLMMSETRAVVGNPEIKWLPERPGVEREQVSLESIADINDVALQKSTGLLKEIIKTATDVNLELPEVA